MGGTFKVGGKTTYHGLGPKRHEPKGSAPTSTDTSSVQPSSGIAQYESAEVKEKAKIPTEHRIQEALTQGLISTITSSIFPTAPPPVQQPPEPKETTTTTTTKKPGFTEGMIKAKEGMKQKPQTQRDLEDIMKNY